MARVVSLGPKDPGRVYRLDSGECLLGRRLDCHITITDQRVSRRHARIRRDGSGYQFEDLGSSNGSTVNGRRVQGSIRLRHGDEIEIGASRFRLDLSEDLVLEAERPMVEVDTKEPAPMIEVANLTGQVTRPRMPGAEAAERDLQRVERKLQVMYRISDLVASTLDLNTLLDKVVTSLLEVFPQASAVAAVMFDPRSQQLRTAAARGRAGRELPQVNIPRTVVDRVLRQGHSVLLRETAGTQAHNPSDTMVIKNIFVGLHDPNVGDDGALGWRMGAPLSFRGEQMGILHVEAEAALGYFTQVDLDLLGSLAAQTGVALHLIGLHQRMMARDRLDHDLRLARQIQRNLLPREAPKVRGLEFAVHYEPAFHVGGDFYDFLWSDPSHLSIAVGDVSGKAVSGALFMARVTSEIRAVAPVESAPKRVLQRVNRALSEVAEDGMFTTMVYLTLDLPQQVARFSNAGHTTPLLRREGKVIPLEFDEARTMPLAVEPRLDAGEAQVALQPGDALMLYTDGIIEARASDGRFYGQTRLEEVFARAPDGAQASLEAVLHDLDQFVQNTPQADDQTIVCLAIREANIVGVDDNRALSSRPPPPRPR